MRLVLATTVALALAGGASASPAHTRLAVTPATVRPGGVVLVTGNAAPCPRGDTVFAISRAFPGHAYGEGALTGRVRAGGAFSIRGRVRRTIRAGRYAVTARCGGGNLGVQAFVRIR